MAFNLFLLDYLQLTPIPCMQVEYLYVTNSHVHQPSEPHQPSFHQFTPVQGFLELSNLENPKEPVYVPRGLSEQPLVLNMLRAHSYKITSIHLYQ